MMKPLFSVIYIQ